MTRNLTVFASIIALVALQACAPKKTSSNRLSPQDRAMARGQAGKGAPNAAGTAGTAGTNGGNAVQPGAAPAGQAQAHPAAGQACRLTDMTNAIAASAVNGSSKTNSANEQQIINAQLAYEKTIPPCDSIKMSVDSSGVINIPQTLSYQEQGQAHTFTQNEITKANGGTLFTYKASANSDILVLTYIFPNGVTADQIKNALVRIQDDTTNGVFIDVVPSRYVVETRGNLADIRITNPSNLIASLNYQVQIQIGGTEPAPQESTVERPSSGTPAAQAAQGSAAQSSVQPSVPQESTEPPAPQKAAAAQTSAPTSTADSSNTSTSTVRGDW